MKLTFINYRQFESASEMKEFEKRQALFDLHRDGLPENLDETLDEFIEEGEISGLELVDVIDESGKIVYQAWFYDFGTAMFFENETLIEVGGACQHGPHCDSNEVYAAFKEAYENANPKIDQGMDF